MEEVSLDPHHLMEVNLRKKKLKKNKKNRMKLRA
jgi:hypothetical protein